MSFGVRVLAAFSAVSIISLLPAQDKPQKELTPKELYLNPRQLPYHAPEEDKTGATGAKGKDGGAGKKKTQGRSGSGRGANPPAPAIGLKFWILKRDAQGQMVEVPPDTEFHSGDAIQIKVETNCPGYLYILNRAASGKCRRCRQSRTHWSAPAR